MYNISFPIRRRTFRCIDRRWLMSIIAACVLITSFASTATAQLPNIRHGEVVPRDVREVYDRGLQYLAKTQTAKGAWTGGQQGPGVTGMALMVFLASGEDPNFGLYSSNVKRALRSIISAQNSGTGYLGNSMYHHGFGMLGLAEAYGAVDDRDLWPAGQGNNSRSIGAALELAVRTAITSQKNNPMGAWRYSPNTNSADTSVSGAILVGLLAARNAGIEVPDTSIDKAISYYTSMTSPSGQVGYSGLGGFGNSIPRTSIASLVYALARRKDLTQYKATLKNLTQNLESPSSSHYLEYGRYYQAQALFQGDVEAWKKWNKLLLRQLKRTQMSDGSFKGQMGSAVSTSLNLLALALNYRFLPIYER